MATETLTDKDFEESPEALSDADFESTPLSDKDFAEEKVSTPAEIAKQVAIGFVNSALMNAPLFAIEKFGGEEAVKDLESESQAGRIARGTGTAAGFVVGLPQRVFLKGSMMAGQAAAKIAPKLMGAGVKSARELTIAQKATRAAVEGAGGAGAVEALTAPREEVTEKLATIPLAMAAGSFFGVGVEKLKPVISRFVSKVSKGNKSVFTDELADELLSTVDLAKRQFNNLVEKGSLSEAQEFANGTFTGAVKQSADDLLSAIGKLKNVDVVPVQSMAPEALVAANTVKQASATNNHMFTSTREYLKGQGVLGKEFVARLDAVRGEAEAKTGELFLTYQRARKGLNKQEMENFVDAAEGRAAAMNTKVENLLSTWRNQADDIAKQSGDLLPEFRQRQDYFPHLIIDTTAPKSVVKDVLTKSVQSGAFKDYAEAESVWNAYKSAHAGGAKKEAILNYLIKNKQAENKVEAEKLLNEYFLRGRQRKFGSLERSREIDLPFYDRNPDRVLPKYYEGATYRLEGAKQFGAKDEIKDRLLVGMREDGADWDSASKAYERFFGSEESRAAFGFIPPSVSSKMRNIQTITKLGLAQIPNLAQSTNTAILTNIKSTAKGIANSFTKEGQEWAVKTGATLQHTIEDVMRHSTGGHSTWASSFLRKTGFTATERMNRTIAANAGRDYINGLSKDLLYRPWDKGIQNRLAELGLNPKSIIEKNGVDLDDLVRGTQNIINRTQFRSGAMDLPMFFTSPEGKLVTQFKTFAFNQTKFIKDAIVKEAKQGNLAPLITAFTMMPVIGEGVADVKSVLTGKSRDTKGLERMAENMAAVGSMGIFSDMVSSAGRGKVTEFLAGPTISDISQVIEGVTKTAQGKPKQLQKKIIGSVPVAGQMIKNRVTY